MSKECEQCLQPSNNKFFNCAPRMNDGRNFTDYRPRCISNFQDLPPNVRNGSYEYRQFMIANAEKIIKDNRLKSYESNRCGPCVNPFNQGTMVPEQLIQKCNSSTCTFVVNDVNGVGLGRQYDNTKPENKAFLNAKEQEQQMLGNMENCCTSSLDDEKYYPYDYKSAGIVNERTSVPGGGYPFSATDRK